MAWLTLWQQARVPVRASSVSLVSGMTLCVCRGGVFNVYVCVSVVVLVWPGRHCGKSACARVACLARQCSPPHHVVNRFTCLFNVTCQPPFDTPRFQFSTTHLFPRAMNNVHTAFTMGHTLFACSIWGMYGTFGLMVPPAIVSTGLNILVLVWPYLPKTKYDKLRTD